MSIRPAFLLSLPRSGSTLLQRLLAAHTQVASTAEPWLLLPPLYALRPEGVYAEYGHRTTVSAIAGLCDNLPGQRADYLEAVASMARSIYDRLSPPGTSVFLDKTPRYGMVVDELLAAFPAATFIVLHRNPVAVLASISSTFDGGKWKPYRHKQDLYLLAERLLSAQMRAPESFVPVRYEDLLTDTADTLQRLVTALGLPWEPGVLTEFAEVSVAGNVGDATGVRAYDHISSEPMTKWHGTLRSPVRRRWARRYLRWLGEERLALMGYDLAELTEELDRSPVGYSTLAADLGNAMRGIVWSVAEVEIARAKLRNLGNWSRVFTHT